MKPDPEEKKEIGLGERILYVMWLGFLSLCSTLMMGWVASFYWLWFVMSVFDVPQIPPGKMGGLFLTAALARLAFNGIPRTKPKKDVDEEHLAPFAHFVLRTFIALILLGLASIYHAYFQ